MKCHDWQLRLIRDWWSACVVKTQDEDDRFYLNRRIMYYLFEDVCLDLCDQTQINCDTVTRCIRVSRFVFFVFIIGLCKHDYDMQWYVYKFLLWLLHVGHGQLQICFWFIQWEALFISYGYIMSTMEVETTCQNYTCIYYSLHEWKVSCWVWTKPSSVSSSFITTLTWFTCVILCVFVSVCAPIPFSFFD